VRTVDVSDAASLAGAIAGVGVVLSTIGPFARHAGPVIEACLAAQVPYVDIANEWAAVRGLLDRDEQARAHAVALVTGAGFGPAATETLVLRLTKQLGAVPDLVRVAAAAEVARHSEGVRQTIQASLSHGLALTYRNDQVVREPLGSGAGPTGTLSLLNFTPVKASAQRPPSPPNQPSAFWPESSPAHGPLANCSAPFLSPMPPARK
jgi:short subunit dehydrogenase-like uncharacterized protein